ncbi:hypothetical protein HMPREF3204_00567 [Gardnerella pickettii]|nr:hypothetical protein HMPREF3204_00567 [Gardnerella pickettii]
MCNARKGLFACFLRTLRQFALGFLHALISSISYILIISGTM